ncbi:hypothetical protein T472_0204455 [Youngiibacter fragilis 232.1]|uniref:SH3b domain-containing protein n=2 Tax=Youngiibacter TaxID=1408818 RepID=V7I955_9CLOT|nr:hypothetical protein T472_0204455 [Youngiibacter fragilis 232.1]
MKRVLAVLIIITMLISACTTGGETPEETKKPEETQKETVVVTDETVLEFKESLKTADDPFEVRKKLDIIMASGSEEQSDTVLADYMRYLSAYSSMGMSKDWDKLQDLEPYFDASENIDPESITDPSLKELYKSLTGAGYKFIRVEGSVEPIVDYRSMESYSDSISDGMKDYLKFKAMDSDKVWAMDAGLVIPVKELGDRIAAAEGFLKKYPDSELKGDVLRDLRNYLSGYFGGLDNTPVADGGGYVKEYIDAYEDFLQKHPDTSAAGALKKYYDDIKAKGFAAPYKEGDTAGRLDFKWRVEAITDGLVSKFGSVAEYSELLKTTENLVIRSKPDTKGELLFVIPKGTIITANSIWNGWAAVHTSGWSGYSSMDYLVPVEYDASHHHMTLWNVNLREGPSTDSKILTQIPAQTIIFIDEINDGWGKTSHAGITGYISMSYVKKP